MKGLSHPGHVHTALPYLKWISNKDLLYNTGNSVHNFILRDIREIWHFLLKSCIFPGKFAPLSATKDQGPD